MKFIDSVSSQFHVCFISSQTDYIDSLSLTMLQSVRKLCLSVSVYVLNCKIHTTLTHRLSTKAYVTLGLVQFRVFYYCFYFMFQEQSLILIKNPKFH